MSCIAGIINLDGRPVDKTLLDRMIATMKGRAPDGVGTWSSRNVGLAHALLHTDARKPRETQPCSLDGKTWIVADARIDGKQALRNTLKSRGCTPDASATDAELILHTYSVFGQQLLDHLIGDFAFAIWDEQESLLFCACDHFGIRPLYYVQNNECLLFASEITALLAHTAVGRTLNETAVGDFLLFGGYIDADMTIYRNIYRLPGATTICTRAFGSPVLSHYWELEEPDTLPAMSPAEYVSEFRRIFEQAVTDRVESDNVALEMSGGMDSTSIAAITKGHANNNQRLTAYTTTCFPLLPDDREGNYAGLVADFLNLPINYRNLSTSMLFDRWGSPELKTDQPCPSENLAFSYDTLKTMTDRGAKVLTSGFMADALFTSHGAYYRSLLQQGKWTRFLQDTVSHKRIHNSLRGMGLRSMFGIINKNNVVLGPLPSWINKAFIQRENLSERWHRHWQLYNRGRTLDQLCRPWLSHHFRGYEAFNLPLVARFPFMDLRLIEFTMGVPNFMKHNKHILRTAMRGQLPPQILTRPKEGVPGDIRRLKITTGLCAVAPIELPICFRSRYLASQEYAKAYNRFFAGHGSESTFWSSFILMPLALELWLSQNNLH